VDRLRQDLVGEKKVADVQRAVGALADELASKWRAHREDERRRITKNQEEMNLYNDVPALPLQKRGLGTGSFGSSSSFGATRRTVEPFTVQINSLASQKPVAVTSLGGQVPAE
jgi:hypothetical protein